MRPYTNVMEILAAGEMLRGPLYIGRYEVGTLHMHDGQVERMTFLIERGTWMPTHPTGWRRMALADRIVLDDGTVIKERHGSP